jgi:dinuclear metal center YbgI/SA1388 family protein
MVLRDELIAFINITFGEFLLNKAKIFDERANGIQIHGAKEVDKLAIGVSLNEQFLTKAIKWGAKFTLSHHGLETETEKSRYSVSQQKRLKLIFKNDLTVANFHFAIDTHQTLGNNAQIIKKLGGQISDILFDNWGLVAKLDNPRSLKELKAECVKLFEHPVLAVTNDLKRVSTIGVVSGSAKPHQIHIEEMQNKKVELFITGESSESIPETMRESGINYFVCGHYATEVFGIKALGEVIQERFKNRLEVKYFDIPNQV